MNVDKTAAAAVCYHLLTLTMWCALPAAGGWGPHRNSSLSEDESPAKTRPHLPGLFVTPHPLHLHGSDWTFLFVCFQYISKRTAGPPMLDPLSLPPQFCGFPFVALQWTFTVQGKCNVGLLINKTKDRGLMTSYKWSYCVVYTCSKTSTLFFI